MGGGARRGRSGFRRQRPVGRRIVFHWRFTLRRATFFSLADALSDNWVPASVQNPDGTLVKAPTARSRQAACRGPLIRLPGNAFGEPLLHAAPQVARDGHRGPCCVRLSAWWGAPGAMAEVPDTRQCATDALTWPPLDATGSTIDNQPTPTCDRAALSGTDRPPSARRRARRSSSNAVVCGSDTTGPHTVVSTATLHGPSSRCRPTG